MDREQEKKKYRDKLDNLINDENTIPGIFNYCDRWCERCSFTSKCTVYLMDEFRDKNLKNDVENAKFWKDLSFIFEVTMDMLKEKMEEFGIDAYDLEQTKEDTLNVTQDKKTKRRSEELAMEYAKVSGKWLEENSKFIEEKVNHLNIIDKENEITISDAIEVILWYQFFIAPKVNRANTPKMFEEDNFEDDDKLGSAKIALIAVERSIEAQNVLMNYFPEKEDEILNLLVLLSKIKKHLLDDFPNVMQFVRPGFDEKIDTSNKY